MRSDYCPKENLSQKNAEKASKLQDQGSGQIINSERNQKAKNQKKIKRACYPYQVS